MEPLLSITYSLWLLPWLLSWSFSTALKLSFPGIWHCTGYYRIEIWGAIRCCGNWSTRHSRCCHSEGICFISLKFQYYNSECLFISSSFSMLFLVQSCCMDCWYTGVPYSNNWCLINRGWACRTNNWEIKSWSGCESYYDNSF